MYGIKSQAVFLLYTDFQNLQRHDPASFDMALTIFRDTITWIPRTLATHPEYTLTPLYILLQGESDVELPIERLT